MESQRNGQVEVYDAAQRCYMPGFLCDIEKNKVLVQFEMADGRKAGQPKWFEWSVVREVPSVDQHVPLHEVRTAALPCRARMRGWPRPRNGLGALGVPACVVRWPCAGRALAVRWPCAGLALALRWPCAGLALAPAAGLPGGTLCSLHPTGSARSGIRATIRSPQGQLVEVSYTDEGSQEPPAWWEAKIVSKKGPFCKVHFLCGSFPGECIGGLSARGTRQRSPPRL